MQKRRRAASRSPLAFPQGMVPQTTQSTRRRASGFPKGRNKSLREFLRSPDSIQDLNPECSSSSPKSLGNSISLPLHPWRSTLPEATARLMQFD